MMRMRVAYPAGTSLLLRFGPGAEDGGLDPERLKASVVVRGFHMQGTANNIKEL